jgi:AraC-like DNA-binding protein
MSETTLSTILQLIGQVLNVYEIDEQPLLVQAGFNTELGKESRVSMANVSQLWELSCEATDNSELGLVAASMFQPTYLKGLGFAWMASKTLADGLRLFVENSRMINTAMQLEIIEKEDQFLIQYQSNNTSTGKITAHPCAIQLGVGLVLKMFRLAAGKSIPVSEVFFSFDIGDRLAIYEEHFQCSVHGNSSLNGLSFSKELLNKQLPTHDPELVELNAAAVHKYIQKMGSGEISSQVMTIVNGLLNSGCPTEEVIAFKMNMSKRTLQRKLKTEGKSYLELLNSVRLALAKEYLAQHKLPITEISYQLGYSSSSTFSRAFKQQTSLSPLAFREQFRA